MLIFFFQAEDGIRYGHVTGVQTCALPISGRFGSLGRAEMVFENERATTVIERPDFEIAVVQIASRLVRQIAAYVDVGENVALGQRIGVIRLGSQVDVVLPARAGLQVNVKPGQRVKAGESILATLTQKP